MPKVLYVEYIKENRGYKTKCWIWQGSLFNDGYGQCKRCSHLGEERAHRYMYKKCKGNIPKGLDLDHLCQQRACINPEHLEPVTRKENICRNYKRNKHISDFRRKLTNIQIKKIRALYAKGNYSQAKLGIRFDIAQSQIGAIVRYKTYKHNSLED